MDRSKYFLTLDVGTTSVKIALFDLKGRMISVSTKEYVLHTPAQNIVELDPEIYWTCSRDGLKEVIDASGVSADEIASIGACSQGETLIALDSRGRSMRNAIVWMDNRSQAEADEIKSALGVSRSTGQPDVQPTWTATKILWLKKNEPAVFENAYKFLLVEDFLVYKLSGEIAGDYALYSSTHMLDVVEKKWHQPVLDLLGIGPEKLPALGESGRVIGTLRAKVAKDLGLSKSTTVISGAMDLAAALVGSGCERAGRVIEITGAAEVYSQTIDRYPADLETSMAIQCHAIPDAYLILGWCNSGGMAFRWLRDTFFTSEMETAESQSRDAYDLMAQMAETVPVGCEGLTFFPYLAGPGTQEVDMDTRGIFWGIEMHHGRAHFARAVMESLAFVFKRSLEEMARSGVHYTDIRVLGGGAKSGLWNRMKADILGRTVGTMECAESASLGMAVLQAVGGGYYSSVKDAVDVMVRPASLVEPDPANRAAADDAYGRFAELEAIHLKKQR
jgi:sugar (pentulose or hexulose) kinase